MEKIPNQKALIIDDEQDICFLLKNLLSKHHFDVRIAHTLREGFHKLGDCLPQLLFLDLNLPDGSGLDLLKTLKHDHPELKIIMISAQDGTLERNRAKEYGAAAYLSKPLNKQVILENI